MSRPVRTIAALVSGLLLVTACGGGDGDENEPAAVVVATTTTTIVSTTALDCAALLTPDEFATIIGRAQEASNGGAEYCNWGADDFNTPYSVGIYVAAADRCATDQDDADGTIEGLGDASYFVEGGGGAAGIHVLTGDRCVQVHAGAGTPNVYDVDIANSEAVARIVVPRLG